MGGKPKSTSTSYSGSSNPAFQPAALAAVGKVNQVVDKAQPGLDALTGISNNTVIPGLTSQFGSSQALAGQGRGYNSDVLSGKYLNGNPYMSKILDQLNSRVSNDVNSQFSLAGRYGSDAHGGALTRELANADSNLLYGDYNAERGRMGEASGAAQQGNVGDTAALLQAILQGSTLPYAGEEARANSLGALFSGGQEKSKQTGSSPIWGAIGAGIGAAGAAMSDRRLKTKIRLIARDPDGLGRYGWRWKSDPDGEEVFGVIADEVKELRPAAYIENFRAGYAGVNYAILEAA